MSTEIEADKSDSLDDTSQSTDTEDVGLDRKLERIRTGALVIIAGLGILGVFYLTRAVLFPIVLALLLNLLFSPIVRALNRIKLPNAVGAGLVVFLTLVIALGSASLLISPASQWLDRAPESFRQVEIKLRSVRESVEKIDQATKKVDQMTEMGKAGEEDPVPVQVQQPRLANTILNTSGSLLAGTSVTLVLLFFMLASGDRFLSKFVELMPTWSDKRAVVEMARNVQRGMSIYLATTTAINIGLGVAIGFAMYMCGLPNALLWGAMAALLNFFPFVGAIVGALVVALVGLLEFSTLGQALIPPALYVGINALEANFITPALLGRSISLNPVMILLSLVLWGWMWGVGGAIIAVPLLAVTKIFCDSFDSLKPCGRFLGG